MSDIIATFTNPEENYAGTGASEAVALGGDVGFSCNQEINAVSTAVFLIRHDIASKYSLETTSTNAIQKNSTMVVARDALNWFSGFVNRKVTTVLDNGLKVLQVEAYGKDGILLNTLCRKDGKDIWTMQTSMFKLEDVPFLATSNYGAYKNNYDTLWPDPTDGNGAKCYLHDSVANSDTLYVSIGNGTYAISGVNQGTKTFSTADNVPAEFTAGLLFTVSGSTGNDGTYTVVSATWTGAQTDIVVSEAIPDATVDGGIVNSSIPLSTSNQGFKVRGWAKIDDGANTEWLYYDGYDDSESDGIWRLRGVKRGELGTTAVGHVATTAVYEKLPKQMAPGVTKLEQDATAGGTYVELKSEQYKINEKLCCFILQESAVGNYRATFAVYDEDRSIGTHAISGVDQGAKTFTTADDLSEELYAGDPMVVLGSTGNDGDYTVVSVSGTGPSVVTVSEAIPSAVADGSLITTVLLTLNDIVETLMTISTDNHGPGFTLSDLNLNCSAVKITRYDYDPVNRPKYTWDAIQELLASLQLADDIGFFYDHKLDKFSLIYMMNDTPAFQVSWSNIIDKVDSLDEVYSAIRVEYDYDVGFNRVSSNYFWHPAADAGTDGTFDRPTVWRKALTEDNIHISYYESNAAGSWGVDAINDGNDKTWLGGIFKYIPTRPFLFGHAWFGDPVNDIPPIMNVNKLIIRANGYYQMWPNTFSGDGASDLRIDCCSDYNSSTHTGTWKEMCSNIKHVPTNSGDAYEVEITSFIRPQCNAIRIWWNYMPGGWTGAQPQSTEYHMGVIHDLIIEASMTTEGGSKAFAMCELSNSAADVGDPTKIYAPDSFRKLRGGVNASTGVAGTNRCEHYPIGVASDQAAISMARYRLLAKQRKYQERVYEYRGLLPGIPRLGITVAVDEDGDSVADYTGVLRQHTIAVGSDGVKIQYSLLNYNADVIT